MSVLVVIRRNTLECYYTDRDGVVSIPFPTAAIADLEVRNEDALVGALQSVLGTKPQKPSVPTILLLSDEACFYKRVLGEVTEDIKGTFVAEIPFSRVASSVIRAKENEIIVATNRELYETLARLFKEMGYSVVMVVPWVACTRAGVSLEHGLNRTVARHMFEAQSNLRPMELPYDHEESWSGVVDGGYDHQKKKATPLGWIIFMSVAAVYLVGMVLFLVMRRP